MKRNFPKAIIKLRKMPQLKNSLHTLFDTSRKSFDNFVNTPPKQKTHILRVLNFLQGIDGHLLRYLNPKIVNALVHNYCQGDLNFILPKGEYCQRKRLANMYKL